MNKSDEFEEADVIEEIPASPVPALSLVENALRAKALAIQVLDGKSTSHPEAIAAVRSSIDLLDKSDQNEQANLDTLQMLTPALGRLQGLGELTDDESSFLAGKVEGVLARCLSRDGGSPYQAGSLLRTLAELSKDGRVWPDESLSRQLKQTAAKHPLALNVGLLSDVLDPMSLSSVEIVQVALEASAALKRPSPPPRSLLVASAVALGAEVPEWRSADRWAIAATTWPIAKGETFAAAVTAHPGLSAHDAGMLLASTADPAHPRHEERMASAMSAILHTLHSRLNDPQSSGLNDGLIEAFRAQKGVQQLATLLSVRSLAVSAGRDDVHTDRLVRDVARFAIEQPTAEQAPLLAAASVAVALAPERQPDETSPTTEHLSESLSSRIARRLSSGLARVLAPLGDSQGWARMLGERWSDLEHFSQSCSRATAPGGRHPPLNTSDRERLHLKLKCSKTQVGTPPCLVSSHPHRRNPSQRSFVQRQPEASGQAPTQCRRWSRPAFA